MTGAQLLLKQRFRLGAGAIGRNQVAQELGGLRSTPGQVRAEEAAGRRQVGGVGVDLTPQAARFGGLALASTQRGEARGGQHRDRASRHRAIALSDRLRERRVCLVEPTRIRQQVRQALVDPGEVRVARTTRLGPQPARCLELLARLVDAAEARIHQTDVQRERRLVRCQRGVRQRLEDGSCLLVGGVRRQQVVAIRGHGADREPQARLNGMTLTLRVTIELSRACS